MQMLSAEVSFFPLLFFFSQEFIRSWYSSVSIATGYGLDDQGSISIRGKIFLSSITSRPALGPVQPPVQWILEAVCLGVKQHGCETDHSPPCSAEVKNGGAVFPLPICLHGIMLN
jgi:hypothetical protein